VHEWNNLRTDKLILIKYDGEFDKELLSHSVFFHIDWKLLMTTLYDGNSKSKVPYFISAERIPALSWQAWFQLVHIFTSR
jgi:hypothetical protein